MTGQCKATGCKAKCPDYMPMCQTHWFLIPDTLRKRMIRAGHPGDQRSAEYMELLERAIPAVWRTEQEAKKRGGANGEKQG